MGSQRNALSWASLAIILISGVWTLFHIIWDFAGQTADDLWGIALLILFILSLVLAFVRYFQVRSQLHATGLSERFPDPASAKFFLASEESAAMWFVVRMNVGAEWLTAGWEKITSPVWGASGKGLAGFVAGALAKAGGSNPAVQGWYAWFLQHFVQPGAGIFSFLVTYGEFAVGLAISSL